VTIVKLMLWLLVLVLAAPTALLVAVALGPVVIGVLCAVGCAALVAAIVIVLGATGRAVESAGARLGRRARY
jgi:hypothetical protein